MVTTLKMIRSRTTLTGESNDYVNSLEGRHWPNDIVWSWPRLATLSLAAIAVTIMTVSCTGRGAAPPTAFPGVDVKSFPATIEGIQWLRGQGYEDAVLEIVYSVRNRSSWDLAPHWDRSTVTSPEDLDAVFFDIYALDQFGIGSGGGCGSVPRIRPGETVRGLCRFSFTEGRPTAATLHFLFIYGNPLSLGTSVDPTEWMKKVSFELEGPR